MVYCFKACCILGSFLTLSAQTKAQTTMKKDALLIIDVQQDFTGKNARMPVNKQQASEMIANLNRLTANADTNTTEIVYIGNEFKKWDFLNLFRNFAAVRGTKGTKLDERLHVVNQVYFAKKKGNAFTNPLLDAYLRSQNIKQLYLTGLKAEACIYQTLKGAVKLGYETTVLTDCIATTSGKLRDKMIARYQKKGAALTTSVQLQAAMATR